MPKIVEKRCPKCGCGFLELSEDGAIMTCANQDCSYVEHTLKSWLS